MRSQYFFNRQKIIWIILISPKLWSILSVISLFLLIRYLILSQILSSNPWPNNTKCLNLSSRVLMNSSILSNLIRNGFGPVEVLYEMS